MQLSEYRTSVRDILHDANANFYSVAQVDRWINRARKKVAENGECVRRLPAPTASLASATVNAGGSGYSTATATVSLPDSPNRGNVQATVSVNLSGGAVQSLTVVNPGAGYVAPATITITGNGAGAMATPVLTNHMVAVPNQEVYSMASVAALFDATEPGLGELIGIQSVSVSWGGMKPTLARRDFSWLQARARSASMAYTSNPRVWAMYGQGATGSFYLWPVPYQYASMELDCYFSVASLTGAGGEVDLIPTPWCEPVFYYAAMLAYQNAQRLDDAKTMYGEHLRLMTEARAATSTNVIPDPYGDY